MRFRVFAKYLFAAFLTIAVAKGETQNQLFSLPKTSENSSSFLHLIGGEKQLDQLVLAISLELEGLKSDFQHSNYGSRIPWQSFPIRLLNSERVTWVETGRILRPDKAREKNSCGEYRLIFRPEISKSKKFLPMTLSLISPFFRDIKNTCPVSVEKFLEGDFISSDKVRSKQKIEINLRSFFSQFGDKKGFSSEAHYLMLSFENKKNTWKIGLLENTPDFKKINVNKSLKLQFQNWLSKNWKKLFNNEVALPELFLAQRAVSLAPYGIGRLHNRPYTSVSRSGPSLIRESGDEAYGNNHQVLLALDGLSCQGCHQQQGMSGFHFLGNPSESNKESPLVRAYVGSAFFWNQQARRKEIADRLSASAIVKTDSFIPFAGNGKVGSLCISGESSPRWLGCSVGYNCLERPNLAGEFYGECFFEDISKGGRPCALISINAGANEYDDEVASLVKINCGSPQYCALPNAGFPGGFCSKPCSETEDSGVCARMPNQRPFSECLHKTGLWQKCLERFHTRSLQNKCSEISACRDDYICARESQNEPMCVPTYMLNEFSEM